MYPPRIWVEYRPVRIGWVISDPDPALFSEAVRLSHCLWGGTYNPILPAYRPELARSLCKTFNVDLLFGIGAKEKTQPLIDEFPHLRPGMWGRTIFEKNCSFVDVYHPMRKLAERVASMTLQEKAEGGFVLPTWQDDDSLASVFLATVGGYPLEVKQFDYKGNFSEALKATEVALTPTHPVDLRAWRLGNPRYLSRHNLTLRREAFRSSPSILVGSSSEIEDLILFWNLRAAGTAIEFFDKEHSDRLRPWLNEFVRGQRERSQLDNDNDKNWFVIRSRSKNFEHDLELTGFQEVHSEESDTTWNGLNVKPSTVWFSPTHVDVIPTMHDTEEGTSVTFPLPNQPFYEDQPGLRFQHFIASIRLGTYREEGDEWSLSTPFLPPLNEFYGRNMVLNYASARSERDKLFGSGALGLVTTVGSQRETVYPYRIQGFMTALFGLAGITVERSDKGLICSRLIRQLGGLQGCRVFKIRGVRELIRKFRPEDSFTRGGAEQIIANIKPPSNNPDFAEYENLHIERREHERLKPADAFNYLLKQKVFRVGLDLTCPECQLSGWTHLDELRTQTTCQFCGTDFDLTCQLKDRGDWRYRRSGLFGVSDDQGGSIPVALTLQQLHTQLNERFLMYAPSMNFRSKTGAFRNCESDFVVLTAGRDTYDEGSIQILIGECKSEGGKIDNDDIEKLGTLADSIPEDIAQVFIMFSKTGTFDDAELALIKTLNREYCSRVIVWSHDELEPYLSYEKHEETLGSDAHPFDLLDMARVTARLFLKSVDEDDQ